MKKLIITRKAAGIYRELIKIENGSTGHSYASVFGRFLESTVTYINIEDPYIRAVHQVCCCFCITYKLIWNIVSIRAFADPEPCQIMRTGSSKMQRIIQDIFAYNLWLKRVWSNRKIGRTERKFGVPQGFLWFLLLRDVARQTDHVRPIQLLNSKSLFLVSLINYSSFYF